jgi:hypothetical protein
MRDFMRFVEYLVQRNGQSRAAGIADFATRKVGGLGPSMCNIGKHLGAAKGSLDVPRLDNLRRELPISYHFSLNSMQGCPTPTWPNCLKDSGISISPFVEKTDREVMPPRYS